MTTTFVQSQSRSVLEPETRPSATARSRLPSPEAWAALAHDERVALWNPLVAEAEQKAALGRMHEALDDLIALAHTSGDPAAIAGLQSLVEQYGPGAPQRLTSEQLRTLERVSNGEAGDPLAAATLAARVYAATGNRDARDVLRSAGRDVLRDGSRKSNAALARKAAASNDDGNTARADGRQLRQQRLTTQGPARPAATKDDAVSRLRALADALAKKGDAIGAGRAMLDLVTHAKSAGDTNLAGIAGSRAIDLLRVGAKGEKHADPQLGDEIFDRYRTFDEPRGGRTSRAEIDRMLSLFERAQHEPKSGQVLEMLGAQIRDFAGTNVERVAPAKVAAPTSAKPVLAVPAAAAERGGANGIPAFGESRFLSLADAAKLRIDRNGFSSLPGLADSCFVTTFDGARGGYHVERVPRVVPGLNQPLRVSGAELRSLLINATGTSTRADLRGSSFTVAARPDGAFDVTRRSAALGPEQLKKDFPLAWSDVFPDHDFRDLSEFLIPMSFSSEPLGARKNADGSCDLAVAVWNERQPKRVQLYRISPRLETESQKGGDRYAI
jgi:hypothetical protein